MKKCAPQTFPCHVYLVLFFLLYYLNILWRNRETRMHSSGMHTVRCSGHGGGVYPSMHWSGGCVYPSMHWERGVFQHELTGWGGVYPSMHWAGGCLPRRGVCLGGGSVCLGGKCLPGGVCWGGCFPRAVFAGVSAWGVFAGRVLPKGCLLGTGVCPGGCLPRRGCLPHTPVNRITDACENITLPQLRCGR